jgi:HSP90 family molecular chaperone
MDNFKELIPKYLKFLKEIVDSDDLSLTISYENFNGKRKLFEQIKQRNNIEVLIKTEI